MAVIADKLSTVLQVKVNAGSDGSGNDIIKVQSFRGVKIAAVDSDLYDVGQTIASLKSTPLVGIMKTDTYDLIQQA